MGIVHSVFARETPACKAEVLSEEQDTEFNEQDVEDEDSFVSEPPSSPDIDVQVVSGSVVATSIADDVLDNSFKFEPICSELSMHELDPGATSTPAVKCYREPSNYAADTNKFGIIIGSGLNREVQTPEKLIEWLDALDTPKTPLSCYETPPSRLPFKRRRNSSLLNCTIKDFGNSPENMSALIQSESECSPPAPLSSQPSTSADSPKKKRLDEDATHCSKRTVNTPEKNATDEANASMSKAGVSPGLQTHARVLDRGETPSRRVKEEDRYPKLIRGVSESPRTNQERSNSVRQRLRASTRTRVPNKYYIDEDFD